MTAALAIEARVVVGWRWYVWKAMPAFVFARLPLHAQEACICFALTGWETEVAGRREPLAFEVSLTEAT